MPDEAKYRSVNEINTIAEHLAVRTLSRDNENTNAKCNKLCLICQLNQPSSVTLIRSVRTMFRNKGMDINLVRTGLIKYREKSKVLL